MYENYIMGDLNPAERGRRKTSVENSVGYLGKIDDARALFEKIFKTKGLS